MERKERRRRGLSIDEAILPLINIVFLLLIFFLVAGRLASGEPFRVEPPLADLEGAEGRKPPLILVGPQGELALDGETMDEPGLLAALTALGREAETLEVRLKPDAAAEAAAIAALLQSMKEAGVDRVLLMTRFARGEPPADDAEQR